MSLGKGDWKASDGDEVNESPKPGAAAGEAVGYDCGTGDGCCSGWCCGDGAGDCCWYWNGMPAAVELPP